MKCTEEQLKTIEDDAFFAMTATEIACHINVTVDEFREEIRSEDSEIAKAYRKGKAAAVRLAKEKVQSEAKIGNPEALKQFLLNLNDMLDDE